MRSTELYLEDIVSAIDEIRGYLSEVDSFAVFKGDDKTRHAVRARLTDIGEAASRLPRELRERYDDVVWVDLIAFRNILVHEYFGLDWWVVWAATQEDLEVLRSTAMKMLDDISVDDRDE